jgi:D-alanyl-D-alanine-carboxypeptidase/D-alanyl-D-alanine-endopeptidase
VEIALGWHIFKTNDKEIIWHNGGTGGYRSFVAYDPKARTGVVALSNAYTVVGVDDIGRHLLDPNVPLAKPPKEHKETTVDPSLYDGCAGTYQLAPDAIFTLTREGTHLFAQLTGQGKAEIFPEGERDYFYKVVDAQITFVTDSRGRATELILHQNGRDQHAKRIGDAPAPKEHKEVTVDPKLFDGYVASYQLEPSFILTVTRQGDHLFVQATGQPNVEIFAEGDRDYFYKVVDAQITFVTNAEGRATGLILHQNGRDLPAKRME